MKFVPRRSPGRAGWPRTLVRAGIAVGLVALLGFAALQYLMPRELRSAPGLDPEGVDLFRAAILGARVTAWGVEPFIWGFRLLVAAAWVGYALMLVGGHRGSVPGRRTSLSLVAGTALVFALLCPPSLSRDVYAYAAFSRMQLLHDQNPYEQTLRDAAAEGDPAAAVYPEDFTCNYGPTWTIASLAAVAIVRGAGLWWQVVALKLLAAGALVVAALCGRIVAARHDPSRANLTLLAIGLNPLLVVEGPGNAHNDLLMMALLLAGLACIARRWRWAGYLLVGFSAAVKFVSFAIVPWLLLESLRGQRLRRAAGVACAAAALILAPTVVGFAPFWSGPRTLGGAFEVYEARAGSPGKRVPAVEELPERSGETASRSWHGLAARLAALAALYLGLSVWIWRSRPPGPYLAAWVVFSAILWLVVMPLGFAWYLAWPSTIALVRWNRLHVALILACSIAAYVVMMVYAVPV